MTTAQPAQKPTYYDPVTGAAAELPAEQYIVHSRAGHVYGPFADIEAASKFGRAASHEGPPWATVPLSPPLLLKQPDPVVVAPPEPAVVYASGPTVAPGIDIVASPPPPLPEAVPEEPAEAAAEPSYEPPAEATPEPPLDEPTSTEDEVVYADEEAEDEEEDVRETLEQREQRQHRKPPTQRRKPKR